MSRRIVIDLYDHTSQEEILDILDALRRIGLDDPRYEDDNTAELRRIADELGIRV